MKADNELIEYIKKQHDNHALRSRAYKAESEPIKHGFYLVAETALLDLIEILEDK